MSKRGSNKVAKQLEVKWYPITLAENETYSKSVGPLTLYLKRTSNEVWIAHDRSQMENVDESSLDWSRWALKKNDAELQLLPLLPDKQVVVGPEHSFHLGVGAEVRIFTRIPVWIGVYAMENSLKKLMEVPSVVLSKTWFGDFVGGELCYWISSTARSQISPEIFQPHTAICTLNIRNDSEEELRIEKLSVKVDHLSLFLSDRQLWSDEMQIQYKGGDQHSDIHITGKVPHEACDAVLLQSPRNPEKRSFAERTFKMLSEITI